jgi:peptidoglycan/xylan/chitin deacetylase (PgdA/CDA1 family)
MHNITSFMFHDVRDCSDDRYIRRYNLKSFLTVRQFTKWIEYITSRYKVISSDQILNIHENNISGKYAILTFDDGLLDHYTTVLPILKHYGIKGTFLVAAKPATEDYIIHSHKIQFILSCVADENLLIERIFDKLNLNNYERISIWKKYSTSYFKDNWWSREMVFITNFLRRYAGNKYLIVDELFDEFVTTAHKTFNEDFYLKTEHIEKLIENGMIVGGHGYTSENLLLLDAIERYEDITKSLDFIKSLSNKDFISFSYPNGAYDLEVINDLKSNGCDMAYTTEERIIIQDDTIDCLRMPRFNLLGDPNYER